jgi:hypothetical protein
MQTDRAAGFALIGGTLAALVTMAFHPTGPARAADFARVSLINRGVHGLAIAGVIATTFGLLRLTRQLAHRGAMVDAALVAYGFGAVAVMFAAIASGFVGTMLASYVLDGGDAARLAYEPAFDYNWAVNQSTTKVYVVTASVGIALWSIAMLKEPRYGRALGLTGLVVGAAATLATLAGLQMDIHGFGAIVLGHGVWTIWTGVRLVARGDTSSSTGSGAPSGG